jgi:integrase
VDFTENEESMKFEKIKGNANHHLFWRGQKSIWIRFAKAGKKPLERSLKTDRIEMARIRRDEEVAKYLGITPKWKGPTLLVEDKFPEFVELKKIKSPATYASIKNQWEKHLKPYFGGMRIADVTEAEWQRYVHEKRKTMPTRKFFNDRKYLSMFLNWMHREGSLRQLPKLHDVDPETKVGKIFTDDEISRLIEHANQNLKLQILMALTMGMRKSEILTLEFSQIDFDKKTIHLPAEKTKIRKARTFGISDICFSRLLARSRQATTRYVFTATRGAIGSMRTGGEMRAWVFCKRRAGVVGRFHDLRHTFLTRAFKESVNPALICDYAGLSLDEAQKTYLHFDHDDTRVVSTLITVVGV